MRERNARLVLNHIWSAHEISRADVARQTGLSRSTVTGIVNDLLGLGVVHELRVARSNGGRPPILLQLSPGYRLVGVEMGSSHVSAVVCDLWGKPLASASQSYDIQGDPPGTVGLMRRLIDRCVDEAVNPGDRVVGIGIAVPCPIDPRRPGQLSTRILPSWGDVDLPARLGEAYGLPVFMDNDANLGALSERWWGAGQGVGDFAFIKVATGVGCGHIINGAIYRGANGIAGEIGHTAIDPNGPRCRCGLNGCLEAMIGSDFLLIRARIKLATGTASVLEDSPSLSLADILAAAHGGDPLSLSIIDEAGHHLGVAVANLVNLMNPETVILGGRLTRAGELLLKPLRRAMRDRALWTAIERTEVLVSPLGDDAVSLGAATLTLQAALDRPDLFRESIPA